MPSQVRLPATCECAQKYSTKQMAATIPGTVAPGSLNSKINAAMPIITRNIATTLLHKKAATASSQSEPPSRTRSSP